MLNLVFCPQLESPPLAALKRESEESITGKCTHSHSTLEKDHTLTHSQHLIDKYGLSSVTHEEDGEWSLESRPLCSLTVSLPALPPKQMVPGPPMLPGTQPLVA